jgi:hypothetical protein
MFFASRFFLLIFAVVGAFVCVELFVQGAATVGAGLTGPGASLADFAGLAGSVLLGILVVLGLKYSFRPPVIRARYWSVFISLSLVTAIGAFVILR